MREIGSISATSIDGAVAGILDWLSSILDYGKNAVDFLITPCPVAAL